MREDDRARPALRSPPISFPGVAVSASAVRRVVERELGGRVPPAVLSDAVLVASELASNAILHASTPFTFALAREGGLVHMGVTDQVAGDLPQVQIPPV